MENINPTQQTDLHQQLNNFVNTITNLFPTYVSIPDDAGNVVTQQNPIFNILNQYLTNNPNTLLAQYCTNNTNALQSVVLDNIKTIKLSILTREVAEKASQNANALDYNNLYINTRSDLGEHFINSTLNHAGLGNKELYSFIAKCAEHRAFAVDSIYKLAPGNITPDVTHMHKDIDFIKTIFMPIRDVFTLKLQQFLDQNFFHNPEVLENAAVFGQAISDFFVSLTPIIFAFSVVPIYLVNVNIVRPYLVQLCYELTGNNILTFDTYFNKYVKNAYGPSLQERLAKISRSNPAPEQVVVITTGQLGLGAVILGGVLLVGIGAIVEHSTISQFIKSLNSKNLEMFLSTLGSHMEYAFRGFKINLPPMVVEHLAKDFQFLLKLFKHKTIQTDL